MEEGGGSGGEEEDFAMAAKLAEPMCVLGFRFYKNCGCLQVLLCLKST